MAIKPKHVKADIADEHEAIETYGKRQQQTTHPATKRAYAGMQQQEKGHAARLTAMLHGLKGGK